MIRETVTGGPSVPEALDAALEEMGVQQDAVEYEVLEDPAKRIFGSDKPAKVRVWLKEEFIAEQDVVREEADADELDDESAPQPAPHDLSEEPLTDEEIDALADAGVRTIGALLGHLGIAATVEEYEGDEGELILDIIGDDLGVLIGRHGRTLDALQVLVSAIANRELERRHPVIVDIGGYRHRRRMKVEDIAVRAAERAVRQKRSVTLRPMTSYERRVVHMVLRNDRRVNTASEGVDPNRCVVVNPTR